MPLLDGVHHAVGVRRAGVPFSPIYQRATIAEGLIGGLAVAVAVAAPIGLRGDRRTRREAKVAALIAGVVLLAPLALGRVGRRSGSGASGELTTRAPPKDAPWGSRAPPAPRAPERRPEPMSRGAREWVRSGGAAALVGAGNSPHARPQRDNEPAAAPQGWVVAPRRGRACRLPAAYVSDEFARRRPFDVVPDPQTSTKETQRCLWQSQTRRCW
jgi:hypothetical protein